MLSPLLIFVVVGLIIAGSFPELRIVENGLKYRYLFVKGLVRWDEMEELVALKRPQGCLALVIKRKGFALFNGLWINALYGTGIGHENPVVLISRGLEQRAEFLSEIAAHSGIQISNRFTQG